MAMEKNAKKLIKILFEKRVFYLYVELYKMGNSLIFIIQLKGIFFAEGGI